MHRYDLSGDRVFLDKADDLGGRCVAARAPARGARDVRSRGRGRYVCACNAACARAAVQPRAGIQHGNGDTHEHRRPGQRAHEQPAVDRLGARAAALLSNGAFHGTTFRLITTG
jgi:hypothetical protein